MLRFVLLNQRITAIGLAVVLVLFLALRSSSKRFWLLSLAPTCWFLLFYSFIVRAYLALGYWPTPYHPDPKNLAFNLHHVAIWVSFPAVLVSAIALVLLMIGYARLYFSDVKYRLGLAYFAMTFAAWWLVVRFDPDRFIEWFVD